MPVCLSVDLELSPVLTNVVVWKIVMLKSDVAWGHWALVPSPGGVLFVQMAMDSPDVHLSSMFLDPVICVVDTYVWSVVDRME